VVVIKVKKGESIERSLRKLKKTMDREGTMKLMRANRYFEKPSEKKRKKSARARARKRMLSSKN
jgi:small subunit ribosomal protein S21